MIYQIEINEKLVPTLNKVTNNNNVATPTVFITDMIESFLVRQMKDYAKADIEAKDIDLLVEVQTAIEVVNAKQVVLEEAKAAERKEEM
jgi:hypothetical protein